ncbi:MAG: ribulose-phosphate 3-epimerase [Solirubrobacterales bacterium]
MTRWLEPLGAPPHLSAGVNGADLANLRGALRAARDGGAALAHVDVMDGTFGVGLTFGAPVVRAIDRSMLRDVHVMCERPERPAGELAEAGADALTIQLEAGGCEHGLAAARDAGVATGVALCPSTPLHAVEPLLGELQLLLLLAVDPRRRGASDVEGTERRLAAAHALLAGVDVALGVDGGVTPETAARYVAAGAELVVAGTGLFSGDPRERAREPVSAMAVTREAA